MAIIVTKVKVKMVVKEKFINMNKSKEVRRHMLVRTRKSGIMKRIMKLMRKMICLIEIPISTLKKSCNPRQSRQISKNHPCNT